MLANFTIKEGKEVEVTWRRGGCFWSFAYTCQRYSESFMSPTSLLHGFQF